MMITATKHITSVESLGPIFQRIHNGRSLTHVSASDSGGSRVTRNERQQRVGTKVSGGDQWHGRRGRQEGAHCQCVQSHDPAVHEMLHRKDEGSGRHAAGEFQEGNDGSGEGDSTDEDAEVGSNELENS